MALAIFLLFIFCFPLPIIVLGHPFYDLSPGVIASGKAGQSNALTALAAAFACIYFMLNGVLITDFNRRTLYESIVAFETMPLMWLRLAPIPILAAVAWSSHFTSFTATTQQVTILGGPLFGNTLLHWSDAKSIDVACSRLNIQSQSAQSYLLDGSNAEAKGAGTVASGSGRSVQPFLIVNFAGDWHLDMWFGDGQQMFAHLSELSNALGSTPAVLYYPKSNAMWFPARHYVIDPVTSTGCPPPIEAFLTAHNYTVSRYAFP